MSENESRSENESMTEVVIEEATEQLDVQGLVDGESLQDQVDSARVGRAVGAQLGEAAGRQLGAAIGRQVHETVAAVDRETSPREFGRDLAGAVRGGVSDAVSTSRERGSALATVVDSVQDAGLGSALAEVLVGEAEKVTESGADSESERIETGSGEDSETDETDSEAVSDTDEPDSEGADADSGDDIVDEIDTEDLAVDDLESFQTDTLRAYLETISYRDLQSIAKDLDVRANLAHEEMADRIVETVSDDGDGS